MGILHIMDLITVFIAEAHILQWQSLGRFLVQQRDLQVVGEATDDRRVLRWVEALQPDLLLLNPQMPKLDGLSVLPRIRIKSPMTRILLLADYFAEDFIVGTLQVGVHGCVLKTAPPTELLKAIRTTHAGELWASRKLLTQVVENLRQRMDECEGFLLEM